MLEDNRIETALNRGEDAFWAAVAAQYPEIKTGDLGPNAVVALRGAM